MPGIIDKMVESQIRDRLSVAHFRVAIEELLAFGERKADGTAWESIFDRIEDSVRLHAADIADLLSKTTLSLLLGEPQHTPAVFGATAPTAGGRERVAARRIVRARLINRLRQEKGCSRSVARKAVEALTERQLDDAIGPVPVTGAGDWLAGVWQFIANNWVTIVSALLPIVLLLL